MGNMASEFERLRATPIKDECPECFGDMIVETIVPIVRGPDVDVGFHDYITENCYECSDGKVDRICAECESDVVTLIMGNDSKICWECSENE